MELTMSMFATQADYWKARAEAAAAAFEREQARADAAEVRAELAEKNAERYLWLRNEAWGGNNKRGPHLVEFKPGYVPSRFTDLAEEAADAAVDAAMALHNV